MTLDEVRQVFAGRVPGEAAAERPPPPGLWPVGDPGGDYTPRRAAAVLCPLFDDGGQAWIVLTRRSSSLRLHTGEVSFPGGRLDEGETPEGAALREAHEEVGLDPASVEVIGRLSTITTVRTPAPIAPFVGLLRGGRPHLVANPAEVERIITVPLAELFADDVGREERWTLGDLGARPFYFFELMGDTVWGATARIVHELLEVIWASLSPSS